MFRSMVRFSLVLLFAMPPAGVSYTDNTPEQSGGGDPWCAEARRGNYDDGDRETACEVREFTLPRGEVSAETGNGSIRVTGEDRNDVLVRALVVANARTQERANEILKQVTINTSGILRADGPRGLDRAGWWVSFRVQAPKSSDLTLRASNGSLGVTDVKGRMRLRTSNGSIRLMDVGGDVDAETSNGSVNATLSGPSWDGPGLNVTTSNGSVRVTIPENYNARLVAGTSNGGISVDFPITVRGRIGREVDTNIGSGGAPIRVRTSNGSVRVQRR